MAYALVAESGVKLHAQVAPSTVCGISYVTGWIRNDQYLATL